VITLYEVRGFPYGPEQGLCQAGSLPAHLECSSVAQAVRSLVMQRCSDGVGWRYLQNGKDDSLKMGMAS
jgi:hypothetical protein